MHLYQILRHPLVTEKYSELQAEGKYAFEVAKEANKAQIKESVEKAFKVTVTGVNLMTVRGKRRRLGRRVLAAHPWKKAIVSLKPGDKIEIFEGTK